MRMRREVLEEMGEEEIDRYMRVLGVDAGAAKSKAAKIIRIERARERTAEIDVLGMTLAVPVKRLHDKRVTDRLNGQAATDEEMNEVMEALLGAEQRDAVLERCTDEDGTVDLEAYSLALATVVSSDELKNF